MRSFNAKGIKDLRLSKGHRGLTLCGGTVHIGDLLKLPPINFFMVSDLLTEHWTVVQCSSLTERELCSKLDRADNRINRRQRVNTKYTAKRRRASYRRINWASDSLCLVELPDNLSSTRSLRLKPRALLRLTQPSGVVEALLRNSIRSVLSQRPLGSYFRVQITKSSDSLKQSCLVNEVENTGWLNCRSSCYGHHFHRNII